MLKSIKFEQSHKFNWYILLWILSLVIVFLLFNHWHFNKQYIGIVERKSHQLSTQEPGRVNQLMIAIGDSVKEGEILLQLDISDLESHLNQLRSELLSIESMENARRQRYALEIQTMGLRLENEASSVMDRLSVIESKSTELAGLNSEIKRLTEAEKAGLGHSRDLASLIVQRDALASYLRELNKDLEQQNKKVKQSRESQSILEYANLDSLTKSMFIEEMEHAARLRREIGLTEHRINLRTLVSPCDGYITELLAQIGDITQQFVPIVTIEETSPDYMTVFLPEKSTFQPEIGMKVKIKSLRSNQFNTMGHIVFVHPGLSQVTERLAFRGQIFWGRKVRIQLDNGHKLIPGEMVHARILKKKVNNTSSISPTNTTQSDLRNDLQLKTMSLPNSLNGTRFEPSGICYIQELKQFLIVSDDTGLEGATNDHIPYLFLMDVKGQVDADPVQLSGIKELNDIEAITPAENGTFYLVSSQNISKKGQRSKSREQIVKLKIINKKIHVQSVIYLLDLILNHFTREELIALGLNEFELDGKPVLNIEGAAFHKGDLFLGLKEPVTDKGALLWKISDIEDLFNTNKLKPGQISIYGSIKLDNIVSGFSDLAFDKENTLWACSTIPDVTNKNQQGRIFKFTQFTDDHLEVEKQYDFPGLKPEGICFYDNQMMIAFDCDDEIPLFVTISIN